MNKVLNNVKIDGISFIKRRQIWVENESIFKKSVLKLVKKCYAKVDKI